MEVGDKEHLHATPGTMPKTSAMCRYSIRRSPPVVIRWGDRNGRVVMNCRSPLSCPRLLRIFLVSIASLPFSIFFKESGPPRINLLEKFRPIGGSGDNLQKPELVVGPGSPEIALAPRNFARPQPAGLGKEPNPRTTTNP